MNLNFSESASLLPRRFVYFADGAAPENFRPEEGGEGGAGVSEAAAEAAAEERRQAAAAAKQQRGEEKKMKKRDRRLAEILHFFLMGTSRDDRMAVLITQLLKRNVPPAVILAVLSLQYPDVIGVLEDYLDDERELVPDASPEYSYQADTTAIVPFGKELAIALSQWTSRIFLHASFLPMKTILSLATHHGVDAHMESLSELMIERFFAEKAPEVPRDRIAEFCSLFWKDVLKKLHKMAEERGLLAMPTQQKTVREEEDDSD